MIDIDYATFAHDNALKKRYSIENKNQIQVIPNEIECFDFDLPDEDMALINVTLQCQVGTLTGICGPVGSGKSSLLLAAMGQLHIVKGASTRYGSCAYVKQSPWMINASIKDNILFGECFDDALYSRVVNLCHLRKDFNTFPRGDRTKIGFKGTNLSLAQQQKIALARAFYADK